jgi:molecular chaperone DnaK
MQTSVTIHVFQGERPMAADNVTLGTFNLDGLAPAPRGVPKIDVTFDIDANGILSVSAQDTATGRSQSIRITGSTRLSEGDKQRMIREAEQYSEQDKKRRADAESLNAADNVAYEGDKTLAEFGDKISPDLRARIQKAIADTKEACAKRDPALASQRADTLKQALQEVGKVVYAQATAAAGPQPGGTPSAGGGGREKVVDAEYTEGKKG